MSFPPKKVINADTGTADIVGGDDWDKLSDYFNDVDNTTPAKINTATYFRDQKLQLRNPANTQTLTFRTPTITSNLDAEFIGQSAYTIYKSGSNIKARNNDTMAVEQNNTDAYTVFNAVYTSIGATSGKCIDVREGTYTLSASLVPQPYSLLRATAQFGKTILQPTGDIPVIAAAVDGGGWNLEGLYFQHANASYTKGLIELREGCQVINIRKCFFYDGATFKGNGIKFSNQYTGSSKGIYKVMTHNCEFYGFENQVFMEVTTTPNWINGNNFSDCNFWIPKNAALKTSCVATSNADSNNFTNCQVQATTSGVNQTVCGFDYDDAGRHWFTVHQGVIVWDLGTGSKYALCNGTTQLYMDSCHPTYLLGGSNAFHTRHDGYYTKVRGRTAFSGNGTTKTFTVTHSMGASIAPNVIFCRPGSSDAMGSFYVDDATISTTTFVITYPVAPPTGTNNLIFYWQAAWKSLT